MPLNSSLSTKAFEELDTPLSFSQRIKYAYDIGLNNISEGIFNIAIKHGIDPRDYSLVAYGAAGPLMLPAIADLIRVRKVIVPPHPGLFSALGLLSADQAYTLSRSSYKLLGSDSAESIASLYQEMETQLLDRLGSEHEFELIRSFDGQLLGQTWDTPFVEVARGDIDSAAIEKMIEGFHEAYERHHGNKFEEIPVQGVTYRVRAVVPTQKVSYPELPGREGQKLKSMGTTIIKYIADEAQIAQVYDRINLRMGDVIQGPAIIREPLSTTHITQNQAGKVGKFGEINIESQS